MNRTFPAVGPRPAMSYDLRTARLLVDVLAKPDDTLAAVAAENGDVFRRVPDCHPRHAPLLRALAADLMLAGIEERCRVAVESVVDDRRGGFRIEPRFEDGMLSWIVDAFEILSREEDLAHA